MCVLHHEIYLSFVVAKFDISTPADKTGGTYVYRLALHKNLQLGFAFFGDGTCGGVLEEEGLGTFDEEGLGTIGDFGGFEVGVSTTAFQNFFLPVSQ